MKADYYEVTELRNVKKGDFFMLNESGRVYIRGEYERSSRKYSYSPADDFCRECFAKGSRKVLVGFTY